jgi:hypothetical protein
MVPEEGEKLGLGTKLGLWQMMNCLFSSWNKVTLYPLVFHMYNYRVPDSSFSQKCANKQSDDEHVNLDDEHVNLVLPIEGMKAEIIAKIVPK